MYVACFQIDHRKSQQHGVDKLGYSNRQTPPVDEPYLEVGGRLVPRLLFAKQESSLVKLPKPFWFQYFEIAMTSCQLDCEFENALANN